MKEERARRKVVKVAVERIMKEVIKPLFIGKELYYGEERIRRELNEALEGFLITTKEVKDRQQQFNEFRKKYPGIYLPTLLECFQFCQGREADSFQKAYNHVYGKPDCSQCQEWRRKDTEPKLDYFLYPGHGYE